MSGRARAARFAGLARLTGELTMAATVESVAALVTTRAAGVLGASVGVLAFRSGDVLRLVQTHGIDDEVRDRWATIPLESGVPLADAVRAGEPVVLHGASDYAARYPDLATGEERSLIALPLRTPEGPVLGAVGLRFDGRDAPLGEEDIAGLQVVANACAQALQRVRAQARVDLQSARLRFLADASATLGSSLDHRETLARVARLAVPGHADWCAVEVEDDGVLRTLAVAHVDPAKVALARDLQSRWPPDPQIPRPATQVWRTGQSLLVEEVTDEMLVASARDEEHLRVARELGLRSALIVPLATRERVVGVLTMVLAESDRRYAADDVPFFEDLGRRAALAIDNADLYSQTRTMAARLQSALQPVVLPKAPGWRLAATYRQAGRTEAGGDYYGVLPLRSGRLAAFVGDVMGRGPRAAGGGATMRAGTLALFAHDPSPAEVAAGIDRLVLEHGPTPLATAAYLLTDADSHTVRLAVAGHPPPLLVTPSGEVRLVEAHTPLHGIGEPARECTEVDVPPGAALLLYTDGLVERRGESIEVGLERLRAEVEAADPPLPRPTAADTEPDERLQGWLDRLVDRLVDPRANDDLAALLLVRTT